MKNKRLTKKQWIKIQEEIGQGKRIIEISKKYEISRHAIYDYGWRHGFIQRQKRGIFSWLRRLKR